MFRSVFTLVYPQSSLKLLGGSFRTNDSHEEKRGISAVQCTDGEIGSTGAVVIPVRPGSLNVAVYSFQPNLCYHEEVAS